MDIRTRVNRNWAAVRAKKACCDKKMADAEARSVALKAQVEAAQKAEADRLEAVKVEE